MKLLSRDEFRIKTFERDHHKCVFCGQSAVDAHHIMERRLFPDGGYYLNNGASVCEAHHLMCEATTISVEAVRQQVGITKPVIPPHLYKDQSYDKWGNPILENGQRLKGELFDDESVQKIIKPYLFTFTDKVKYPRTYHLPWSENITDDDRVMPDLSGLIGKTVIMSEKMDGENTTMYRNGFHARSVDGRHHWTRDWVKNYWSQIAHEIPEGWRICGENLFAEHSIAYENLYGYFYGFAIWDERNVCLDWDTTIEWFRLLNIPSVPTISSLIFDEKEIKRLADVFLNFDKQEGYIIRTVDEFHYRDFRRCVGKYVRKDHVQTVKHWMFGGDIKQNKLITK